MNKTDFKDECLAFPDLYDIYQSAVFEKAALLESLREIISDYAEKNILDCSVGTGFVIIDLIKEGVDIVCADGSSDMLKKFSLNAQSNGIKTRPIQIDWENIGSTLPSMFDLILCRGNSIVYADMWDKENVIDSHEGIRASLKGIFDSIKLGGKLYIDIPSDAKGKYLLGKDIDHHPKVINGKSIRVSERIEECTTKMKRKWDVKLKIENTEYGFSRFSHLIKEKDFIAILEDVGFKEIEKINSHGERNHHCAFLVSK
ncbi:class I SAM-dependent methyltransferase [Neptunomonas sp.]|uniref:class I SAM-dependent methyltransferase n=1 Tax=Neptunomonas TaxID=75687 RepID=UPI0035110E17